MPLIRKKTSKRITTHKRQRIKHKIKEGKRKKRKEAKKNPQWKSKKKKDPGIPSNLPFKDEIIAEITEQRRQVEEEKRKRKEDKILSKEAEGSNPDANTTDPSTFAGSSKSQPQEEAPLLLNPDLPNFRAVIDKSHIVLNVLDARDPLSFRISHIEDLASHKKDTRFAFVLNKIDLIPRESATAWLKYLRSIHPTFAFRSASAFLPKPPANSKTNTFAVTKGKAKESEDDALGSGALLEYFNKCVTELQIDSLRIAIIGITNVGKSSMVNSLVRKATVPVYEYSATSHAGATTTTRACEIEIVPPSSQASYILIDTPGVSFERDEEYTQDVKVRDILMRRRGRVDKVKDPLPLIDWIVSKANTQDLMLHYNLPAFAKGDTNAFLSGVARTLNVIRKGGELDFNIASRSVLRDWNTGKLLTYTEPQKSSSQNEVTLSESDESILAKLQARKEMWREKGLVKLETGEAEGRQVALDAEFIVEGMMEGRAASGHVENVNHGEDEEDEDDEEEDDDDGDDKGYESDNNEEDQSEGSEDQGEDAHPISRKRKATNPKDFQPSKKVAFAAGVADRNEKKAARKLQQQVKEKQKAKAKTSALLQEKSHGNKDVTTPADDKPTLKTSTNAKPKSTSTKPRTSLNKSSSKASSAADPNAYDFDQFFKTS